MANDDKARTERQLAADIASGVSISERAGRDFMHYLIEAIVDDLVTYGRVELRGLGTFAVSTRKGRKGIHPKTGKAIKIPPSRFVRFRSSIDVRRRLNQKPPTTPAKTEQASPKASGKKHPK